MLDKNFEEAIPLKSLHFPNSLFKYRTLNDKTIECISEKYCWLSEISLLNDPFECSIQIDNDQCLREVFMSEAFLFSFTRLTGQKINKDEIEKLAISEKPYDDYINFCRSKNIPNSLTAENQLKSIQNQWTELIDDANKNLRICSFSEINNSLLLWSHYSNEHKGICIEYDFNDCDTIRPFIQPIIYSDKIHKISPTEELTMMNTIISSLIKSKDWEYEYEWRLTIFKQKDIFPQKMKCPNPKAIYLGTRFSLNPENIKEQLFDTAKANDIPIFQMTKDPNEFKLVKSKSHIR